MDYVKIKIDRFGHYAPFEIHSEDLGLLGSFLTSDVRCLNYLFYKNWALDENAFLSGGNYSSLEKEDGFILIGCEFSEEPDRGPYFKLSIEEFVKILDQWEEFCKTKPKEILITRENDVIKMEGKW